MLLGPKATTGSDARSHGPAQDTPAGRPHGAMSCLVSPGTLPVVQVWPPSVVVAHPVPPLAPASARLCWNVATALSGLAGLTAIDGSIWVSGSKGDSRAGGGVGLTGPYSVP